MTLLIKLLLNWLTYQGNKVKKAKNLTLCCLTLKKISTLALLLSKKCVNLSLEVKLFIALKKLINYLGNPATI